MKSRAISGDRDLSRSGVIENLLCDNSFFAKWSISEIN